MRYVKQWGWVVWDGKRWVKDDTGQVERYAKETVRSFYQEAACILDDYQRNRLIKHASRSESRHSIDDMVRLAQSDERVVAKVDAFDANPMLLNVNNGTINLTTGELQAHNPLDLITKLSPIDYAPNAHDELWSRFLWDITEGKAELVDYLQRAMGYTLTGLTREECLFICYGTGRNGKSKLLGAIQYALGDYAKSTPPKTFLAGGNSNEHAVASLAGARYVVTTEIGKNGKLDTELVKQLTGGDVVTARHLYKDEFDFKPALKLWIATNNKPAIDEASKAVWVRIKLIPFNACFEGDRQDKHLEEKLHKAAPTILNWLVQGCLLWQEAGLHDPECVEVATREYRDEQDDIADFFEDVCEKAAGASTPFSDLYTAFTQWQRDNGAWSVITKKAVAVMLKERGYKEKRAGVERTKVYVGLRLRTPVAPNSHIPTRQFVPATEPW